MHNYMGRPFGYAVIKCLSNGGFGKLHVAIGNYLRARVLETYGSSSLATRIDGKGMRRLGIGAKSRNGSSILAKLSASGGATSIAAATSTSG